MGVVLMDLGLLVTTLGAVSLLKPLRWVGIGTRRMAAMVVVGGLLIVALAVAMPAPLIRSARAASRIDEFIPAYQFWEHHETRVRASASRIFWSIKTVPAEEIRFFRTLTWLRNPRLPGRPVRENIMAPTRGKPILDVATSSGFGKLAEDADRELVVGTLLVIPRDHPADLAAGFKALAAPGYVKAVLNFLIEPEAEHPGWCRLSTETRVFATDPATRWRFAAYWRVIYPGSALIRVEWLRAIRRRAEGPEAG